MVHRYVCMYNAIKGLTSLSPAWQLLTSGTITLTLTQTTTPLQFDSAQQRSPNTHTVLHRWAVLHIDRHLSPARRLSLGQGFEGALVQSLNSHHMIEHTQQFNDNHWPKHSGQNTLHPSFYSTVLLVIFAQDKNPSMLELLHHHVEATYIPNTHIW